MGYFRVGDDWDGLAGLDGPSGFGAAAQPQLVVRRSIPVGSIVPTLRARKPVKQRTLSASDARILEDGRRRIVARLQGLSVAPQRILLPIAKNLRGFIPLDGIAGFGASDDALTSYLHSAGNALLAANQEIDAAHITTAAQQALGGTLVAQRMGEIAGTLGIDATWQDFVNNSGSELSRIYTDFRGANIDEILKQVNFQNIAATFNDQGATVGSLRTLADGARNLYAGDWGAALRDIVGDAAAGGEGGLRQLVEQTLGAGAASWLTKENVQRLSGVVNGWIGAGQSGSVSGYVSIVGTTIGVIGGVLGGISAAVPAGTIIAAVGAFITLLAMLLGNENPDPLPEAKPCVDKSGPRVWQYNTEAWTALGMWLVAKDGKFFDSDVYREAESSGKLVQQVAAEMGWFTTIDRYTGEVMVQEPSGGGPSKPMRRLLDIIDRDALMPPAQPTMAIDVFSRREMYTVLGLQPRDSHWGGANFLWCQPDPGETFTRFLGADQHRTSDTKPFRKKASPSDRDVPYHIGEGWIGAGWFWRGYTAAMVTSMYLGGTVPYGVHLDTALRRKRVIMGHTLGTFDGGAFSTGVGGAAGRHPIEVVVVRPDEVNATLGGLKLYNHEGSDQYVDFQELIRLMSDEPWKKTFRIPDPSPEVQASPGTEVQRRGAGVGCSPQGMCMRVKTMDVVRRLAPGTVIKRSESGMGRGTKIALAVGGGIVVVGGGYLAYRHLRRRG